MRRIGIVLMLLGIAGDAAAECAAERDATGDFVAAMRALPMDTQALDGWLLATAGPTGCAPVAVGSRSARSGLAQARAITRAGRDVVFYVNGVANTPEIECDVLRELSKATGATAIGVYNGTDGLAQDIGQVLSDKMMLAGHSAKAPGLAASRNQAVLTLKLAILEELAAGRNVRLFAHSQGGAITSLALYEAKAAGADLSRVTVTTFAAATSAWPQGARYEHYVHNGDAVPVYAGIGSLPQMPSGRGVRTIRFGSGGISATANHDVIATYLPRWRAEHPGRNGSW